MRRAKRGTPHLKQVLLALLLATAACTATDDPAITVTPLDGAEYVRDVHPYVAARCGTLDCHGLAGRPLRIYSELGLRARAELRGQPITAEELAANVSSFAAVSPGLPLDDDLVLRKPLAPALGGIDHKGLALWPDRNDPGYLCLRGWLAGQPAPAACAAAYLPVKIADPPDGGD